MEMGEQENVAGRNFFWKFTGYKQENSEKVG